MKKTLIVFILLLPLLVVSCFPLAEPDSIMSDSNANLIFTKHIMLEAPVWDDVSIAMSQVKIPASLSPTWTPYKGSQVPAFSDTQVNVLYFSAQLPHSYKEGTDIKFHIHVVYPDAAIGNSVWYFTYSWANMGDIFPLASNATITQASTVTTDEHQLIELTGNINGTGKEISSILLCSIQRTGTHINDTYNNVIYLISGDFHYQIDTIGSKEEFRK